MPRGRPCKYTTIEERCEAQRRYVIEYNNRNKEKKREYARRYYQQNKERLIMKQKERLGAAL